MITYSTSEWTYTFHLKRDIVWISHLKKVKKLFKTSEKPLNTGSLHTWLCNNLRLYKGNTLPENRQEIFDDFYNSYLFLIEKDKYKWKINLEKISDYFDKYNKKPPSNSSLYIWLRSQQKKYIKDIKNGLYFHNNENIDMTWSLFCDTYTQYVS